MSAARGPFRIELVDYAAAAAELHRVRAAVFVVEQQVPAELETDALDAQCRHVVARDPRGQAIGTGRLDAQGRIGRMAVLRDWRGAGVGAAMLQALLREARAQGCTAATLHAQVAAQAFYARHGFVACGARFFEAGIEHQAMRRALDHAQAIDSREAAIAVTAQLIADARRTLYVYSRELDPGLLDQVRIVEALRHFATRSHGSEVRVLLQDAAAPQAAHAPLLALAQRLPSVFGFRAVDDPVDRGYAAAFIANDHGGYYYRGLGHRFDGEAENAGAGRARQLIETFRPVWERARPISEYRALGW